MRVLFYFEIIDLLRNRALKSPQLLELSGIGDRKILETLGIPIQVDLPGVGENLQEHLFNFSLGFGIYFFPAALKTLSQYLSELKQDADILSLDLLADAEQLQRYLAL